MWQNGQPNIELDGIVIVTRDNTASMTSLFGRKTKVFDGNDKIVRVVQLQTANGFFVRPVSKLVLLMKVETGMSQTRLSRDDEEEE